MKTVSSGALASTLINILSASKCNQIHFCGRVRAIGGNMTWQGGRYGQEGRRAVEVLTVSCKLKGVCNAMNEI